MNEVVGVLLAAGNARRYGGPKLLQPLKNGMPVIVATAQTLMSAVSKTIVVVRPGDHALTHLLTELDLEIVENPLAREGMGSSLAAGVNASARADGWLIMLADMPWVRPATLSSLVSRMNDGASLVAPVHAGRRGHPVGFSSRWLEPLREISGDRGARDLISANANELEVYTTDDTGVLQDIDRPQDLDY